MDELLLRYHIKKNGDTTETLAKVMDIHVATLRCKLQNKKYQFTQREIAFISRRYNFSNDEIMNIFFNDL